MKDTQSEAARRGSSAGEDRSDDGAVRERDGAAEEDEHQRAPVRAGVGALAFGWDETGTGVVRIGYRTSTVAALLLLAALTVAGKLLPPPETTVVSQPGGFPVISYNPCPVLIEWTALFKISWPVWVVTFIALIVLGLMNRQAPRWLSIPSLITFGVVAIGLGREMAEPPCHTIPGIVAHSLQASVVGLMSLHQILRAGAVRKRLS